MIEIQESTILSNALKFIQQIIEIRLKEYFIKDHNISTWDMLPRPDFNGLFHSIFYYFRTQSLTTQEYIVFLLALAPHIKPHFFDDIIADILPNGGDFPQLGGCRGKKHRGFLPTGETALFILAGEDLNQRFLVQRIFNPDHFFHKKGILWLEEVENGEPSMSGRIILSEECIDLITQGQIRKPRFGYSFPAQYLETEMDWSDLVLNPGTSRQIKEIGLWLKHQNAFYNTHKMRKKIKPGYRVLFYGPPGTGKTLAASLLGKYYKKDVYRVDLALTVSKYIGETEKNLATLFDRAENKDWILFFDEADALFGKRTQVKDAHDRYANQETSYLLQRVEQYDGLVILASNFKENIDEAFLRRFHAIIQFPIPSTEEKIAIWNKAFPPDFESPDNESIRNISQKYKLTGAAIMNIVQYCSILALERGDRKITGRDILTGIKKEFLKEGKIY